MPTNAGSQIRPNGDVRETTSGNNTSPSTSAGNPNRRSLANSIGRPFGPPALNGVTR